MKITVPRSSLLPALAACAEVADAKGTAASHACVIIETMPVGLRLRVRSGDHAIACSIPDAEVHTAGTAMVHARDLLRRVEATSDGLVRLMLSKQLEVKQGSLRFALGVWPAEEIPAPSTIPDGGGDMEAPALLSLLSRIKGIISNDASRPYLCGVWLRGDGSAVTARASDGHRVARCSIGSTCSIDTMIPDPAVKLLIRVLGKSSDSVRLCAVGPTLYITHGAITYSTQLACDSPLDFDRFFPERDGRHVVVSRDSLDSALRAVGPVAAGDAELKRRVRLRALPGNMIVRATDGQGAVAEQMLATSGAIENCPINYAYLIDALKFFTSDEVEIWQANRKSLMVVRAAGDAGTDGYSIGGLMTDAVDETEEAMPVDEEEAA